MDVQQNEEEPAFLSDSTSGSAGPGKSGEAAEVPEVPVDVVPTERPKKRKLNRGYPINLRRQNEARKIQSVMLSERLRDLRLDNPTWPLKRVAAELGIHRVHASRLWAVWVKRAEQGPDDPKAVAEVRAFLEGKLLRVVQRCEEQIDENASYAAGTLKALEMWARLRGVDLSEASKGADDSSSGEIARIAGLARERSKAVLSAAPPVAPAPVVPPKLDATAEGVE